MKSSTVTVKVDEALKIDVERILSDRGLSMSEAIELYMARIRACGDIPFDIRIPNKETLKTFEDTDKGKNLIRYKSAKDMFKKLGI